MDGNQYQGGETSENVPATLTLAGGATAPVDVTFAPGMTEPLPAPDPEHAHQLKILRIR